MALPFNRDLRLYALCGILAPALFAVLVLIESSVVPGYSQVSQPVSDLGAYALYGSYALIQNVNFWIFGILVVLLARGLGLALPGSKSVTMSLTLFGIMIFVAGIFPDEPTPFPSLWHMLAAGVALLSAILCQFLFWRRLRNSSADEQTIWGRYRMYSLVSGCLSLLLGIVWGIAFPPNIFGVEQRIFLAIPWLWLFVIGQKLYRLPKIRLEGQ